MTVNNTGQIIIWGVLLLFLFAIAFALVKAVIALIKSTKTQKLYSTVSIICVIIMLISWFMNFGWIRVIFTVIPLALVHVMAFVYIIHVAAKYTKQEKKLKLAMIVAQLTFVLSYVLLPDGADSGEAYVFFGLIHSNNVAKICETVAIPLSMLNIALLVVIFNIARSEKKKIKN